MSSTVSDAMLARLIEVARHKVVAGMATLESPMPDAALRLAADLHAIAGEATRLDRPELSVAARSLRRLGYLLQEASEALDGKPGHHRAPTETPKVLIVDDSPIAALALADVFEMHDYVVRVASTYEKAVELLSSFGPDVLVSDVHMPALDVAELCRRFRSSSGTRRTAVVLVSGRSAVELRERLEEIKPDVFVSKLAGAVAVLDRVNVVCRDLLA